MKPNRPLFVPALLLLSIAALHQYAMWYERTHTATEMADLKRNLGILSWSVLALLFALPTSVLLLVRTFRLRRTMHSTVHWACLLLAFGIPLLLCVPMLRLFG